MLTCSFAVCLFTPSSLPDCLLSPLHFRCRQHLNALAATATRMPFEQTFSRRKSNVCVDSKEDETERHRQSQACLTSCPWAGPEDVPGAAQSRDIRLPHAWSTRRSKGKVFEAVQMPVTNDPNNSPFSALTSNQDLALARSSTALKRRAPTEKIAVFGRSKHDPEVCTASMTRLLALLDHH